MKSRKEEFTVKGTKYPCLKIATKHPNGTKEVVLFTDNKTGMVVETGQSNYRLGYYVYSWNETEAFEPYHGEIILSSGD